jgi:hypothetical protein
MVIKDLVFWLGVRKELSLWVKDARRFLFYIPRNKAERNGKLMFMSWIMFCSTVVILCLILRGWRI